eukprot:gb/GEZN01012278.1/.p1 GENE.gb/GEZN01012278.1/~~gb/GEZN01012278.1/.p1  ORF type:complete len:231 (+),score=22.49 gb/GEZN01012278.1/:31-723(+)
MGSQNTLMNNVVIVLLSVFASYYTTAESSSLRCPSPQVFPGKFDVKAMGGTYFDYLSTADYDAETYCVLARYLVQGEQLLIEVQGFHGAPPGSGGNPKEWQLYLEHDKTSSNSGQFVVVNASLLEFVGTQINFFYALADSSHKLLAWSSCKPYSDLKDSERVGDYDYEIHVLYEVTTQLTSADIDLIQHLYIQQNLNPLNQSLKISPHPSEECASVYKSWAPSTSLKQKH